MTTPVTKLSTTGDAMPMVGMGLWKVAQQDAAEAVYQAIKAGYRMLDGAADYNNEVCCSTYVAR